VPHPDHWITNHGGVPKDLVPCTDEQAYWHGCAACRWELKIHEQFNNDATHTLDERENRKTFSARRKKGLGVNVKLDEASFAKITHRQEMRRVVSGTQRQSSSNTSNYMYVHTPCEKMFIETPQHQPNSTNHQPTTTKQVDLYNLKNKKT
jgi:hypothetical protein